MSHRGWLQSRNNVRFCSQLNMKRPKVLTLEQTSLQRQKPVNVNARFKFILLTEICHSTKFEDCGLHSTLLMPLFKNETRWNTLHSIEISNGGNNAYLLSLRTGHRENLPLSL